MPTLTRAGTITSHYYKGNVLDGVTGPVVLIPDGIRTLSVGIVPIDGGSGKVQYTLSSPADVEADAATWRDWPSGVVSAVTDDTLTGPVTAVRAISASGEIRLEVVGG